MGFFLGGGATMYKDEIILVGDRPLGDIRRHKRFRSAASPKRILIRPVLKNPQLLLFETATLELFPTAARTWIVSSSIPVCELGRQFI